MRIEEIDKNFEALKTDEKNGIDWYDIKRPPFKLYGFFNPESENRFHRLPKEITQRCNERVGVIENHTAGGRVTFKTDSPFINIKITCPDFFKMTNMALSGSTGFDFFVKDGGVFKYIYCMRPNNDSPLFWEASSKTPAGMHDFVLYFPLYNPVNSVLIGLQNGSKVLPADEYEIQKPIVFYGSSITQGAAASRPAMSYEALISHRYNANFINLGFSGCAHGEKAIAEYIAKTDISALVLDYDHNASGPEHLIKTHYQFYETVRNAHPDIPIIMVSRPLPVRDDTRRVIKESYEKALKNGDKNAAFIDGETLFAGDHITECTVDGAHPNDLGFYRMSKVIGKKLEEMLGLERR